MAIAFSSLSEVLRHGYDTVIDVRSPAEFAEDHIPGAINLPAMSNEERARVGTIYAQVSPFDARKVGAAILSRNLADHLDGPLAGHPGAWRPLVYCWRGGQRSGAFASILSQVGWRAETVAGGYRSYRRLVQTMLYEAPLPYRLVLLDGFTGSAKTEVLHRLAARGHQILDLEGLACHRGSMLGGFETGQPTQKAFESALAAGLVAIDPDRPLLVEAESSKIGRIILPPSLWTAMCAAPRIVISAPAEARAGYLVTAYADVLANQERLETLLHPLRAHRGHATVDGWVRLLRAGDKPALTMALIKDHYDPSYTRSRAAHHHAVLGNVWTDRLDDPGQERLADAIAALIG
jgi:tRNA 2-selenouridine synthase